MAASKTRSQMPRAKFCFSFVRMPEARIACHIQFDGEKSDRWLVIFTARRIEYVTLTNSAAKYSTCRQPLNRSPINAPPRIWTRVYMSAKEINTCAGMDFNNHSSIPLSVYDSASSTSPHIIQRPPCHRIIAIVVVVLVTEVCFPRHCAPRDRLSPSGAFSRATRR